MSVDRIRETKVYNGSLEYRLDELFTAKMIMEIFDIGRVTVYNWLGEKVEGNNTITYPLGKFPNAFKSAGATGKIYIPKKDVESLIERRSRGYK